MTMPTAENVARAIVCASRATGADPVEIAEGARGNRFHPEIVRARAYAAIAIRAEFDDIDPKVIARMVGVRTAATSYSYLKTLDEQRERGFLDWWDDQTFLRVIEAIQASILPAAHGAADPISRARELVPVESRRVITRIAARPIDQCQDVTAEFMGDPPRGRSALAERLGK